MTERISGSAPPILDSEGTLSVASDVGALFVHRDDQVITPTIVSTGAWEPDEGAFLRTVLSEGQTFLDVGANIGYFTLLAAGIVGPQGRVFAVEPEPRNLALLRANVWRNQARNVTVIPLAADRETDYLPLRLSEENRGDHQTRRGESGDMLVPSVRLDDVLGDARVDVVKVDTQGVDHDVVDGLQGVIARNPGIVLMCEFWLTGMRERGVEPGAVLRAYRARGLGVELVGAHGVPRTATDQEVLHACETGANDFVNVVLRATEERTGQVPNEPLGNEVQAVDPAGPAGGERRVEPSIVERVKDLADAANRAGGGYHVFRPLPGVVISGEYDMLSVLPAYHLPDDLSGKTVLDVGTASGFFAMECARRGASVTAVDVVLWDTYHWQIAELLGWDVRRIQSDIYDLSPSIGVFDLVICGSLLLHLPDPVGAIRRLRSVCRERAIISTACPAEDSPAPLCEFVGEQREGGAYWAYWNIGAEALRRMLLAAPFDAVEHQDHFTLETVPDHPNDWSIRHAVAHGVLRSAG